MIRRRARFRSLMLGSAKEGARERERAERRVVARPTARRRSRSLLTGLAAVVAVAVALPSSVLVLRALDPLFAVPWGDLGAVRAGVVLVTVGGAGLVGRTARRDTGGQVLRDAARPPPRH